MVTGVRIDELDPTVTPSFSQVVPAMEAGLTTKLTIQQIADLLTASQTVASMSVGVSPPLPPLTQGALWFDSDAGNTYVWYDDGNSQQWVQMNVPGATAQAPAFIQRQVFISSGPITLHADTKYFFVQAQGAGGAGGGAQTSTAGEIAVGGGGSGGGCATRWIARPAGAYSPSCTVGAGGNAVVGTTGGAGGSTSFTDGTVTLTGSGGTGGTGGAGSTMYNNRGSTLGGGATGGDYNFIGGDGGACQAHGSSSLGSGYAGGVSGEGGGTVLGPGPGGVIGYSNTTGGANGRNATNIGAGGAGGIGYGIGANAAGGGGGLGAVIITEFR